jgi:hypothetical protein
VNRLGALALDQDARAAEHRKNLAVWHLRTIGCKANGFISAEDLVRVVRFPRPVITTTIR